MTPEEYDQKIETARGKFLMAKQMFEAAANANAIKPAITLAEDAQREIPELITGNNFAHYPMKSEVSLFIGHAYYQLNDDENATQNYRRAVGDMNFALAGQGNGYDVAIGPRDIFNYVVALQSLTIGAAIAGNIDEARLACGTGLGYATVLMNNGAGNAAVERALEALSALQEKLGGNCPVYITDDPYNVWPYE
jgi:tetratricopeptide (TPR) repeat protein